jgi:HEAT repeat protein
MTITMEEVRAQLTPMEPDYTEAIKLGPEALPHLEILAESNDLIIAPRAVYLASLIGGEIAERILLKAAKNPSSSVRVQAAGGARNLRSETATRIFMINLEDSYFGVRNIALKSIKVVFSGKKLPDTLQSKITTMSKLDPEQFLRESSGKILKQ